MVRQTLLSAMALAVLVSPLAGQQVYRGTVDPVRLPVVVLAKDGSPIRGLTVDDFEVLDGGRAQQVAFFAEGPPGPDVPLHLGIMLDRSESMELDLKAASDAAIKFIDALDEAQDVTLVEYEKTEQVSRFSPSSYAQLFSRIRNGKLGPLTALNDAIGRYVETTRGRSGQHVLLLYTDGGDSARGISAADVQTLLRMGDVMVYVMGYVENLPSSERLHMQSSLTQLAHETGGEAFFPSSVKDVTAAYARIRAEIDGRYTLGYIASDDRRDGRFRRVEVRLRHPNPGVRLRTRSGYMALNPDDQILR
jgi:Ca-activated chloride channel family protein